MLRRVRKVLKSILEVAISPARAVLYPTAPLAIQYTPDSALSRPSKLKRFIADRQRLATCAAVAWFHDSFIATLNLAGNAVYSYRFDSSTRTFMHMQTLASMGGLNLPLAFAFSPDGELLAISNSVGGVVNLFKVDLETHMIAPTPAAFIKCTGDNNLHGVSFSPCGRILLYSTIDTPGYLRLFKIRKEADGRLEAISLQEITNPFQPLVPKGVAFSPNGHFVAVSYANNAGHHTKKTGFVAIYAFHANTGLGLEPVCIGGARLGLSYPEDVSFLPDASCIVVTDQAIDMALVVAFDARTGVIGERKLTLRNPRAKLSFPHGHDVSRDSKYLAIANYGDDKVCIYTMTS